MTLVSYGTNVHPAEDLPGILAQLDRYAVPVRERLGADRLGLGLWLPAGVAAALRADRMAPRRLRDELHARGLAVVTLNAFPFRGFHEPVVKHAVYRPAWNEPARLRYTADCAHVLAELLPDDADHGSISTLPLGWRTPWSGSDDAHAQAALEEATTVLHAVSRRHGRPIVLAVEPEPGCVLDTVEDAVAWLSGRADPEYVGICLDTCHLAVSFADPAKAVAGVYAAGLRVTKVQLSAALHVEDPADPAARAALAEFAEPRYLHQVRARSRDGWRTATDDLPEALERLPVDGPWRAHYHVPLHATPAPPLRATTEVIVEALAALRDHDALPHLEVETYTWDVLPARHRQDLVHGMAAELSWARRALGSDR